MKILLLLLLSVNVFAQDYKVVRNITDLRKSASVVDGSVAYVLGYRTQGDGGGGVYVYSDTSRATDDGGAIIKSNGLAGAWIHEVQNKIVNLKWWGIRPLSNTGTEYNLVQDDIYQEFTAALKFIRERAPGSELYIEAGTGGVWNDGTYYSSGTWPLNYRGIAISGTRSAVGYPETKITWPARKLCINIPVTAYRVRLEHLLITQLHGNWDYGDSTGHGIYTRAQVDIDNVRTLNLAGDGLRIEACADVGSPIFGQADFSVVKNFSANYTNYGVYVVGCDANKITFDKLELSNTRRWGVFDNGFLGNDYKEPHFSATGYAGNNNKTSVIYNGKYYQARFQMDGIDNTNKRPDLHPEHWNDVGGHAAVEWQPNTRYWSAGTFALINDNAWNMIWSPYTEDGQAPGYLNSRSELRNGTRGTGTFGGSQSRILFGNEYNSANQVAPSILLGIGVPHEQANNTPLHVFHDNTKGHGDAAIFESGTPNLWVHFQNSQASAKLNLNGTEVKFHTGGNIWGVHPQGMRLKSLPQLSSSKLVVWDSVSGDFGWKNFTGGSETGGDISQATFDAAISALQAQITNQPSGVSQSAFNALQTRVNSLDAIIASKASKEDLKVVSDAIVALTARVNAIPTTGNNTVILQQTITELQAIINRLKALYP